MPKLLKRLIIFILPIISLPLSSCGDEDDEPKVPTDFSSNEVTPQVTLITSGATTDDFTVAFRVKSVSKPNVTLYWSSHKSKTNSPSLNKHSSVTKTYDEVKQSAGHTWWFYKVTHAGFSPGDYVYFKVSASNSEGSDESNIDHVIIKHYVMAKGIKLLVCATLLMSLSTVVISCDKDSEEPGSITQTPSGSSLSNEAQAVYNKLHNTTWTLISSPYDNAPLGNTITFSSDPVSKGAYKLFCSSYPGDIFAWMPAPSDGGDLLITPNLTVCNASNGGALIFHFGCRVYLSLSGDRMTLTDISHSDRVYVYFITTTDSDDGVDNDYDKPDVEFFDYTQQGSTSVKVDFIIYNKDKAGISSASIKYGTSSTANSSVSTNIVGNHILATISGLKANTKYYVKCTVKGKGGTVTTDAVTFSLSAW